MIARRSTPRSGFAMVVVLLVLLALLVLCAPFLLTVRNADRSSAGQADRASARVALDTAARHARAELGESHPARDTTPYADTLEELAVGTRFDAEFLNAQDSSGAMWEVEARDVSGLVDLNSAPPQVLAELFGGATRLLADLPSDGKEISVVSTGAFGPQGFLWVGGELVGYGELQANAFRSLVRGLGSSPDEETECGPLPATTHPRTTPVIDERALAIARWRTLSAEGELRRFDTLGRVREAGEVALGGALDAAATRALARTATVHGGVGAGAVWQRGTRLTRDAEGGADCRLSVADARWFSPGTTVRIDDGITRELGIVRAAGPGRIELLDPVRSDYRAYAAVVQPLARRPVNVNTAPPEVLRAIMLNLQLLRRSAMITAREADALVEVVVQSRPFDGFEDFVRRVVLPAGGFEPLPADAPRVPDAFREHAGLEGEVPAIIDPDDARALYKNALNANDSELAWSTMPFAFTSTDVHALSLRASVNALSGIERVSALRDEVRLVVPQEELLHAFARQEDFDLALRLDREAPGWATGPLNTGRHDPAFGSTPPPRSRAHLGPADTFPSQDPLGEERAYTFASREDDGWIQPAPSRVAEVGELAGRVLHFDDETNQLEGRYLPDGVVARPVEDELVGWSAPGGLLRPLGLSMWIRPRSLAAGEHYLDVGGQFPDTDRISLLVEEGNLVLRVLDAMGDHPDTPFEERAEVRYPLAAGPGAPGLPPDTWAHVALDVRGNAPSQIAMLVDGRLAPETPGLTRLTSAITDDAISIPVESTDGFPEYCAIGIGNEVLEVQVAGPTSFLAQPELDGPFAGFGGRIARTPFVLQKIGEEFKWISKPYFDGQIFSHPAGAAVELYGYSTPLASQVPLASGSLPAGLGAFAVARAVAVDESKQGDPIFIGDFTFGYGLDEGSNLDIELGSAGEDHPAFAEAFNPNGGYALLVSREITLTVSSPQGGGGTDTVGGKEVIYYNGRTGNTLHGIERGNVGLQQSQLQKKWIFEWEDGITTSSGVWPGELLTWSTFVIPISVPGGAGFPTTANAADFAQITHPDQAELTEWVRYDEVARGHLVRSDEDALELAHFAAIAGILLGEARGTAPGTGGGGPGPIGGGGPGGGGGGGGGAPLVLDPPTAPPEPPAAQQGGGSTWMWQLGEAEDEDYHLTRAVRTNLQHRGVLGTFSHDHSAGTAILPVWRVEDLDPGDGGIGSGIPGRLDAVALVSEDPSLPAFPTTVHRAVRPREHVRTTYQENGLAAELGEEFVWSEDAEVSKGDVYVALEDAAPSFPFQPGSQPAGEGVDARVIPRLVKFPSGELPRLPATARIGGSALGGGGVPSAVVDEIAFGTSDFGNSGGGEALWGGRLVVLSVLGPGAGTLEVGPATLRTPRGDLSFAASFLSELPPGGGLLRIGDEILAYVSAAAGQGTLTIPAHGRGLLGTDPASHDAGEAVSFLEHWPATVLTAGIAAESSSLPVAGTQGFPSEGLVLVGDELVHYTWIAGGALEMPRASTEPGELDAKGPGIFRGRFGTQPSAHPAGTAVVLFPFRYADRWSDGADAPELHYFQVSLDQPNAYWRSVAYEVEEPAAFGPRLRVLQRTSRGAPWDALPDLTDGIDLLTTGIVEGGGNPIGVQSDRVEWRVHVRHEPGSFDPVLGASHGWKLAPRLRWLAAEYLGPGLVLERVER